MSEKKAKSDRILNDNRHQKITGVLSGFTYNTENELLGVDTNSLSVDDLLILLKKLIRLFDPKRFQYFEDILNKHIVNYKNPHKTTLDQLTTSVLNELYLVWKEFDPNNTGTIDDFVRVLFQNVVVANIEDTLEGTSTNKVTSVAGVVALINKHNEDPNAHYNLLNNLFPGDEIIAPPEFSLLADIGNDMHVSVEGPATTYVGPNGYIYTTENNTIPVDYSFLVPMFSIWESRTNLITDSCNFESPGWVATNIVGTQKNVALYNPFANIVNYVTDFVEVESTYPVSHDITYETFPVTIGQTYTISVYGSYIEGGREVIGIRVPTEYGGEYNGVRYSLLDDDDTYFLHEGMDSKSHAIEEVGKLAFGKIFVYSFKALKTGNCSCIIWGSDLIDGDGTHIGVSNRPVFRLYAVQVEKGLGRSPFIYTSGTTKTREGIYIYKEIETSPLEEWFNPYSGTIVCQCQIPQNITTNNTRVIYGLGTINNDAAFTISFPMNHERRAYFEVRDISNISTGIWSTPGNTSINYGTYVQSYALDASSYLIASNLNDNKEMSILNMKDDTTHIFIGCDRTKSRQLNGYIRSLVYYPFKVSPLQATYFVSGE